MKRTIAWLLFFALVLTMAASCGTVPDSPADTAGSETRPPETEPVPETEDPASAVDLPEDLDFGGADFRMLSPDQYGGISFVEDQNGEVLNDAQYQMKLDTEERLKVKITEVPTDFWKMKNTVIDLCMTGDTTYASIVMMDRYALACAYEDCFFPLQNVEHVDLSKLYWGGGINDALSVGGKNFFGVGAFNLTSYTNTACIYYNRSLGEDLGIGDGPAAAVYAGTWTLDAFKSYDKIATADLNGDGVMDEADRYTYGTMRSRALSAQFWVACGVQLIRKDENDIPYFAADGDEKFLDVIEYTYDLMYHSPNCLDLAKLYNGKRYSSIKCFAAGQELFSVGAFYFVTQELRDMASDDAVKIRLNVLAASSLITSAVIAYKRLHPEISFDLSQNESAALYDMRVSTFAHAHRAMPDDDACSFEEEIFLAVPNIDQYRKMDSISLSQMKDEKFIGLAGTKQLRNICNEFCRDIGVQMDVSFESDNTSAIKDAVASGIGVCFWPEYTWGRVERRKIRLLKIVNAPFRRELLVTMRKNKADNRNTEHFYKFLVAYLKKHFRRRR